MSKAMCLLAAAARRAFFWRLVYPQISQISQIDKSVRRHPGRILCLTMNLVYMAPAML
nr:hypothetical protein [Candidatus Accumulibacter phosphatis]